MIATKVYNWHGKLIGYNCDENYSWVPVEPTLHGYQDLMQKISDGNCILQEPQITNVQKAYNRENVFNGYIYCDMFIPLDNTNHLYNLIESRINSGVCSVTEPARLVTASIKEFIVCITFPTPWQSLKSTYEADICYPINDNATSYYYHVRFFNVPISDTNELELLNHHYSINEDYSSFASEQRFYVAVLEVTIPIDRLRSIFRIQKKLNLLSDHILDAYNMHMQHTGRSQREGPDIGWLIQHFNDYSFDPIADIGNRAIDAISLEGWEEEPKYISQRYFSANHIVYKCLSDERIEPGYFQFFGYNNKILAGQAGDHSEFQLANRTQTTQHSFITKYERLPLLRIRQLVYLGLTVEAISLLNAYLEVSFKHLLLKCVLRNNPKDNRLTNEDRINAILKWGYRKSLAVIKEIANSSCLNATFTTTFNDYIGKANEIYKQRNLYLHNLELADDGPLISYTLRRKLEDIMNPFLEPYLSHQFQIALDIFAVDCPLPQITILDNNIIEFYKKKISR